MYVYHFMLGVVELKYEYYHSAYVPQYLDVISLTFDNFTQL